MARRLTARLLALGLLIAVSGCPLGGDPKQDAERQRAGGTLAVRESPTTVQADSAAPQPARCESASNPNLCGTSCCPTGSSCLDGGCGTSAIPAGCPPSAPVECSSPVCTQGSCIAFDESGLGNHLTIVSSQAAYTRGLMGGGITRTADCADLAVQGPRNGFPTTGPVTIEAWVNSAPSVNTNVVLAYGAQNGLDRTLLASASHLAFMNCSATTPIADGGWHLVAGTFDGTRSALFLDGQQVCSAVVTGNFTAGNGPVVVGGTLTSGHCWTFDGDLDEVRVLDRAASPSELAADFAVKRLPRAAGTVALWRFDEGSALRCCPAGGLCGADGRCEAPDGSVPSCPAGAPNACDGGRCCPAGTQCGQGGCFVPPSGAVTCPGGMFACSAGHCCPNGTQCAPNGTCAKTPSVRAPNPCGENEVAVHDGQGTFACCPAVPNAPVEYVQTACGNCRIAGSEGCASCTNAYACCGGTGIPAACYTTGRTTNCAAGQFCPTDGGTDPGGCCPGASQCSAPGVCCPTSTAEPTCNPTCSSCGGNACCAPDACDAGTCVADAGVATCSAGQLVCGSQCCAAGELCVGGRCSKAPPAEWVCPSGRPCGTTCCPQPPAPSNCAPGQACAKGAACCPDGYVCSGGTHPICTAIAVEPATVPPGPACGSGQYCAATHVCTSAGCCPQEFPVGCGGTCCSPSASCTPSGCQCPDGRASCGPVCCGAGTRCVDGACVDACPAEFPNACGNNCCSSESGCAHGRCTCPASHPTECGAQCCLANAPCRADGCGCPPGREECAQLCCGEGKQCRNGACVEPGSTPTGTPCGNATCVGNELCVSGERCIPSAMGGACSCTGSSEGRCVDFAASGYQVDHCDTESASFSACCPGKKWVNGRCKTSCP